MNSNKENFVIYLIMRCKIITNFAAIFISLAILISCKKDKNPDDGYDPSKPSFRTGSKWVYVLKAYDQNGILVNESEDQDLIVRDTAIGGVKYFITNNGTYFTNKPDGHYFFEKNNNREVLYFKYPATLNSSYSIPPAGPFCVPLINISVENVDTTYSGMTKTYDKLMSYRFNYIIVTCQGSPSTAKYLFSPKVGLFVYTRYGRNNNNEYSTIEMKSFTY